MSADEAVDREESHTAPETAETVSEPSPDNENSGDQTSQFEDLSPAGGRQTGFNEDGELEPIEESYDTSLDQFGADIDPVKETKQEREQATSILKDDRDDQSKADKSSEDDENGEQGQLFPDVNDGQQTLNGKEAHNRFLFDED